jgi:hypothetical protein
MRVISAKNKWIMDYQDQWYWADEIALRWGIE